MLTVYEAADGALIKREGGADHPRGGVDRPAEPDQGRGPADRAGALHLGADARGDVRDRGLEPPLSGGRRALHDGRRPASARIRRSSRRSARPSPSSWPATASSRCATRSRAPFQIFLARAQKKDAACMTGAAVLVGLLEAIIDREADRVERIQSEVDKLSQTIFGAKAAERTAQRASTSTSARSVARAS